MPRSNASINQEADTEAMAKGPPSVPCRAAAFPEWPLSAERMSGWLAS